MPGCKCFVSNASVFSRPLQINFFFAAPSYYRCFRTIVASSFLPSHLLIMKSPQTEITFLTKQASTSDGEILTGWPEDGSGSRSLPPSPVSAAAAAVKCHCQLLFLGFHGLCETHFLRLNTLCQGRKGPISKLLCPGFDRKHLKANGSRGSSTDEISISSRPPSAVTQWLHFLYTGLQFLHSVFVICRDGSDVAAVISGVKTLR